jgi:hypothetical protein
MLICFNNQAQINKVYMISFFAQREIDPGDFGTGLKSSIMYLTKDTTFKTEKLIQNFYTKFMSDFAPKFPFPIITGDEAWTVNGYSNLLDGILVSYKKEEVSSIGKSIPIIGAGVITNEGAIGKSITLYPDADAVMTVQLFYRLSKQLEIAGMGTAKVFAYAEVRIYDKGSSSSAKFKLSSKAKSDDSFTFALGGSVFETAIIQKLIEQATTNLFKEMDEDFPKQIKKMEKKLKK